MIEGTHLRIRPGYSAPRCGLAVLFGGILVTLACAEPQPATEASAPAAGETWAVTAWGQLYEVFPEVDALVAGVSATAHTHVTVLEGFKPLAAGTVEVVLKGPDGEEVFQAATGPPSRPGLFEINLRPASPGERDLLLRIRSAAGHEEIRGGRVRVGTPVDPGGVVVAPAPRGARDRGEPLELLKEEQWRAGFSTSWVRRGTMRHGVRGPARVRAAAGGEVVLTAPVDAIVLGDPWPYPGRHSQRGAALLRLMPRISESESLSDLEADANASAAELATARARAERLEELFAVEATSRRELEEAGLRVEVAAARHTAARRDLELARAVRQVERDPGENGAPVAAKAAAGATVLRAPFGGAVAEVGPTPGEVVEAGDPLVRLVRTDPLWLEVALTPDAAARLVREGAAGLVLSFPGGDSLRFSGDTVRVKGETVGALDDGVGGRMRLVSTAPELDPDTGTVAAHFELRAVSGLVLGRVGEAQVLLGDPAEGIVIPASALVDDGGVDVVYLQLAGERFTRQQVQVLQRQGERVLVEGLVPGQRLVTRGGAAIRRAALMAGGQGHGHVH